MSIARMVRRPVRLQPTPTPPMVATRTAWWLYANPAPKAWFWLLRLWFHITQSTLYGVWSSILYLQFPVSQGYIARPQDQHTSQVGEWGFSDQYTYRYLTMQCKKARRETQGSVWAKSWGVTTTIVYQCFETVMFCLLEILPKSLWA